MDSRSEEIGGLLKEEVRRMQDEYRAASLRFDSLTSEVPSGMPHPDGALRIRQAGRLEQIALEKYIVAMKRFADFTIHGTIPDDLP